MKEIHVAYTILETLEVSDDASYDEIEVMVFEKASELGIIDIVNDMEWDEKGESNVK